MGNAKSAPGNQSNQSQHASKPLTALTLSVSYAAATCSMQPHTALPLAALVCLAVPNRGKECSRAARAGPLTCDAHGDEEQVGDGVLEPDGGKGADGQPGTHILARQAGGGSGHPDGLLNGEDVQEGCVHREGIDSGKRLRWRVFLAWPDLYSVKLRVERSKNGPTVCFRAACRSVDGSKTSPSSCGICGSNVISSRLHAAFPHRQLTAWHYHSPGIQKRCTALPW